MDSLHTRFPLLAGVDCISSPAMAIRFSILGSSSSGNCAYLETEKSRILIHAGFSARRIGHMLEAAGLSIETIDAVFLTHEHGDHTTGLSGLCRKRSIPVFANRRTAHAINPKLKNKPAWRIFETGSQFTFQDLTIESFSIPHDAHDPVGFVFRNGSGDLFEPIRSIAWLTDLGYATELVRERIRLADILVLESNHDPDLLKADTRRPWSVKQRITGRHGHLSNQAAFDILRDCPNPSWKHVYLAHLSRDCNSLEAVDRTFAEIRSSSDFTYSLDTVAPDGPGTPVLVLD